MAKSLDDMYDVLERIATALESNAKGGRTAIPAAKEADSAIIRNVEAIGWMVYLHEKHGRVSKADIARAMGYKDHTGLRRLSTFCVVFDRMRCAEQTTLKGGATRRNGKSILSNDDSIDDE